MTTYPTIPLDRYQEFSLDEMRQRLNDFYTDIARRRTVREFSDRPVPRDIIETALKAANTATCPLSTFPILPRYCRQTPTDFLPLLR